MSILLSMPLSLLCFSFPPSLFPSPSPSPSPHPQFYFLSTRVLSGYLSSLRLGFAILMMGFIISLTWLPSVLSKVPGTREPDNTSFLSSSLLLCPHQALLCLNRWSPLGSGCQSGANQLPGERPRTLGREGLDALSISFSH